MRLRVLSMAGCVLIVASIAAADGQEGKSKLKRLKNRMQRLERKIQQLEASLEQSAQAPVTRRQHGHIPPDVYVPSLQRSFESYYRKKIEERLSMIPGVRVQTYVAIGSRRIEHFPPVPDVVKAQVSIPSNYFRSIVSLTPMSQSSLEAKTIRSIEQTVRELLPEPRPNDHPYPRVHVDQYEISTNETAKRAAD